jgi:glycosyltransferase involved in cell wall biosynthesis
MKRILLVSGIFPPDIGGPATFIPALAEEFARLGHRVTVFCRADEASGPADAHWPFAVRRIVRRPRHVMGVGALAALWYEVRRHDLVFANGLEQMTRWACAAAGRPYAAKVVGDLAWERARNAHLTRASIDEFQVSPPRDWRVALWRAERTQFAQQARLVITPSDYLRRMVIGWGVPAERVQVMHNGIDLERFADLEPARREPGPLRVVFIGRLVNWKGVTDLLEATAELSDCRLAIVGAGPEEPALRGRAAELGLGARVEFCGPLPPAEVRRRLGQSHVLALPSQYEGLAHTLLEACAAGVPSVASEQGGNPEVIQSGRDGLLVPFGDVPALRRALQRLAGDEAYRLQLARAAKQRSRDFDARHTMPQIAERLLA